MDDEFQFAVPLLPEQRNPSRSQSDVEPDVTPDHDKTNMIFGKLPPFPPMSQVILEIRVIIDLTGNF